MLTSIQISLTRDSVCMGDDVEDHTKIIDLVPQLNVQETIMNIAKIIYRMLWDMDILGTVTLMVRK